jgi:hypothetical protein
MEFLTLLSERESSGNQQAVNQLGYLGLYQMGEAALIEAGFIKNDGKPNNNYKTYQWTELSGVTSYSDFLNSNEIQNHAVENYFLKVWSYLKSNGSLDYIGKTVNGVLITESGILGAAHLVGVGAVSKWLKNGGNNTPVDGNGVSAQSYLELFGGYDVSGLIASKAADELKVIEKIDELLKEASYAEIKTIFDGFSDGQKNALMSLTSNGVEVIGPKLANGLYNRKWVDVYYEIVYGSNRLKDFSGDKKIDGRSFGKHLDRLAQGAAFIEGFSIADKESLFNKLKENKAHIEQYLDDLVDLLDSGGYKELSEVRHNKLFNDLNDFMDSLRADLAVEGVAVPDINFNASKVIHSPSLNDVDEPARVDPVPPRDPEPVDPPEGGEPTDPPTDPDPVDPTEPSTPPADPIISIKETKRDGYTLTEVYFNDDSGTSKILMAVPDFNPEGPADAGYFIGFPNSNNHIASILRNPDGTVTYRFVDKNGNAATDLTLGTDRQSIDLNHPLKGADGEWIRWEDAIKKAPLPEPEPPHLPPPPPRDPLALDLSGDGVVQTLPMSRGIHFDLDNSGFAERTSWVAPEDGLLVLDRNNNNFIDGGAELFGTETLLSNGKYAKHGFEALAEFDVNQDGAVDANDAVYSTLRIWRDANSNGVADSGELK